MSSKHRVTDGDIAVLQAIIRGAADPHNATKITTAGYERLSAALKDLEDSRAECVALGKELRTCCACEFEDKPDRQLIRTCKFHRKED